LKRKKLNFRKKKIGVEVFFFSRNNKGVGLQRSNCSNWSVVSGTIAYEKWRQNK